MYRKLIFLGLLIGLGALYSNSRPGGLVDNCRLTEQQVRQLWAAASLHSRVLAEQTEIAEGLIKAEEDLCRSAKPISLPPDLQRHVR